MVQIYQNPVGINANNVATQHNPDFAAFNAATSSAFDAPISLALNNLDNQQQDLNRIRGLGNALLADKMQRDRINYNLKLQQQQNNNDELFRLKLHAAQRGYDPSNYTDIDSALSSIARMNESGYNYYPNINQALGQPEQGQAASISNPGNFNQQLYNLSAPFSGDNLQLFADAVTETNNPNKQSNLTLARKNYIEDPKSKRNDYIKVLDEYMKQEKEARTKIKDYRPKVNFPSYENTPHWFWRNWWHYDSPDYLKSSIDNLVQQNPWLKSKKSDFSNPFLTENTENVRKFTYYQRKIRDMANELQKNGYFVVDRRTTDNIKNQFAHMLPNMTNYVIVQDRDGDYSLYSPLDNTVEPIMKRGVFVYGSQQ